MEALPLQLADVAPAVSPSLPALNGTGGGKPNFAQAFGAALAGVSESNVAAPGSPKAAPPPKAPTEGSSGITTSIFLNCLIAPPIQPPPPTGTALKAKESSAGQTPTLTTEFTASPQEIAGGVDNPGPNPPGQPLVDTESPVTDIRLAGRPLPAFTAAFVAPEHTGVKVTDAPTAVATRNGGQADSDNDQVVPPEVPIDAAIAARSTEVEIPTAPLADTDPLKPMTGDSIVERQPARTTAGAGQTESHPAKSKVTRPEPREIHSRESRAEDRLKPAGVQTAPSQPEANAVAAMQPAPQTPTAFGERPSGHSDVDPSDAGQDDATMRASGSQAVPLSNPKVMTTRAQGGESSAAGKKILHDTTPVGPGLIGEWCGAARSGESGEGRISGDDFAPTSRPDKITPEFVQTETAFTPRAGEGFAANPALPRSTTPLGFDDAAKLRVPPPCSTQPQFATPAAPAGSKTFPDSASFALADYQPSEIATVEFRVPAQVPLSVGAPKSHELRASVRNVPVPESTTVTHLSSERPITVGSVPDANTAAAVIVNPQPPEIPLSVRNNIAPDSAASQTTEAAEANANTTIRYASSSRGSTSRQGKPSQQTERGQSERPASTIGTPPVGSEAKPIAISASTAPDAAGNLFTQHDLTPPVDHPRASNPPLPASSNQHASNLPAWQNYDGGAGRIVRSASLTDSSGTAEMHVELRTGTLGPVDVHAVVREGSLGAQIHVHGHEAHTLLSAGLPSLERALADRHVHVENLAVYQDQSDGSMSGEARQDSESSASPHQQVWKDTPQPGSLSRTASNIEEPGNPAHGLSVRA